MTTRFRAICGAIAICAVGSLACGDAATIVDLHYKGYRTWDIELPAEAFTPVSGGIPIAHAGGGSFAAGLDGTFLRLDADGDGELDRTLEPATDDFGTRTARVTLRGNAPDGAPFRYAVRLRDTGKGWQWATACAMVGKIGDTPVTLIDQNQNGRYDDYGKDAMIVGRRNAATFLSRVVSVGGELLAIDVSLRGDAITARPYAGETGTLDMTAGCSTNARLMSAIVRSADGSMSFDLGDVDGGLAVPAGDYEIHSGRIGLGRSVVRVRRGKAAPLAVGTGETVTFDWGGPVTSEFDYMRQGDRVVFSPNAIWYYGAAGEEYHDWYPIGKSPEFTLTDRQSGSVLEVLILPGSC